MNSASRLRTRLSAGAALVPASLAAVLVSGSVDASDGGSTIPASPVAGALSSTSGDDADAVRVVLRVGDELATATLEDTPAAREFAAMLPLELSLSDPMGQAKSGRLPHRIGVAGAERVVDPAVADIYYWPPSGDIGIVYYDLDHSVPRPGMVRLGSIDSGLESISSAGNRFTVSIGWT